MGGWFLPEPKRQTFSIAGFWLMKMMVMIILQMIIDLQF